MTSEHVHFGSAYFADNPIVILTCDVHFIIATFFFFFFLFLLRTRWAIVRGIPMTLLANIVTGCIVACASIESDEFLLLPTLLAYNPLTNFPIETFCNTIAAGIAATSVTKPFTC